MPKRQNTIRVAADEVQGEGAFVVLRRLPWARQQEAQRLLAQAAGGTLPNDPTAMSVTAAFLDVNEEFTRAVLRECVVAWNWVDDAGEALPLPHDEASIALLSGEEVQFIVRALQGAREELKN